MPRSAIEPRPLTASVHIAAPVGAVWTVVADVRRTGEWSPECVRVVPIGGVRRGGLLLGLNRRRAVRWATVSRIHVHDPGKAIGWTVLTNRTEWTYRLDADDSGVQLHETRRAPRGEGRFAVWFTNRLLGGQTSHDDELEAGMRDGLNRIKQIVEATQGAPRSR